MIGDEEVAVTVEVDGTTRSRVVEARMLLVDFIRDELGLTGTHIGCDSTNCGACTVLLDGRSVKSCTMFAPQAHGRSLRTVEGLSKGESLSPLQRAFHLHHALQCGYCTPGMLMSATYLLERNPAPSVEQIRDALAGNLCRCTGYTFIVEAVQAAARETAEAKGALR